jgi:hypothetical protein
MITRKIQTETATFTLVRDIYIHETVVPLVRGNGFHVTYCEELELGGTGSTKNEALKNFAAEFKRAHDCSKENVCDLVEETDYMMFNSPGFPIEMPIQISSDILESQPMVYHDKPINMETMEESIKKANELPLTGGIVYIDKPIVFKGSDGLELHILEGDTDFCEHISNKFAEFYSIANPQAIKVLVLQPGEIVSTVSDFDHFDIILNPNGFMKSRWGNVGYDETGPVIFHGVKVFRLRDCVDTYAEAMV